MNRYVAYALIALASIGAYKAANSEQYHNEGHPPAVVQPADRELTEDVITQKLRELGYQFKKNPEDNTFVHVDGKTMRPKWLVFKPDSSRVALEDCNVEAGEPEAYFRSGFPVIWIPRNYDPNNLSSDISKTQGWKPYKVEQGVSEGVPYIVPVPTPPAPEIGLIRKNLQDLQRDYADLLDKYSDLSSKYSDLFGKYERLQQDYAGLEVTEKGKDAEITALERDKIQLEEDIRGLRDELAKRGGPLPFRYLIGWPDKIPCEEQAIGEAISYLSSWFEWLSNTNDKYENLHVYERKDVEPGSRFFPAGVSVYDGTELKFYIEFTGLGHFQRGVRDAPIEGQMVSAVKRYGTPTGHVPSSDEVDTGPELIKYLDGLLTEYNIPTPPSDAVIE